VFAVNIAVDAITADGATEDAVCGVEKPKANRMDSVDARLEPNMAAPLTDVFQKQETDGPETWDAEVWLWDIPDIQREMADQSPPLRTERRKAGAA